MASPSVPRTGFPRPLAGVSYIREEAEFAAHIPAQTWFVCLDTKSNPIFGILHFRHIS